MAITTIPGATSSDLTTLKGTELADSFTLEGKSQFIEGLAGADTISAASGIEGITIDAGADNDNVTLSGEANTVLLDLKGGNDNVTLADSLNSTITGGDGSDTVTQTANRTFDGGKLFGRSGNDVFSLVNATNAFIGGDQDDDSITSTGTVTNSTIRGGKQRDTITLAAAGGLVKGDNNEDQITVTGTATGLYVGGDGGNDVLTISSASVTGATVRGGLGADDINIQGAALLVKGDKGNDDIDQTVTNAKHTIFGGAGNDNIAASSTSNLLIMGDQATEDATRTGDAADGNDTITLTGGATSGAHTIMGGAGKDTITTQAGNFDERIDGGSGADVINGDRGQDTILGRAGADTINITGLNAAGTNRLVRAGADNDKITFDANAFGSLSINDTYAGEKGTDTIALIGAAANFNMTTVGSVAATSFDNVTGEIFALGSTSTNELALGGTVSYTFSAQAQTSGFRTFDATHTNGGGVARRLNLSAAAYSSAAGVTISGSADGDVTGLYTGGSGADTLNDGAVSTAAADTLTGGAGIDTFNITATTTTTQISDLGVGAVSDIFTVSSAANGAAITVSGNYVATAATSNNLSLAAVAMTGLDGVDINMSAATGNFGFTIDSGNTAATLQGSAKADAITGAGGNDSLVGNAGDDTITPAAGADTVVAGAGNDSIVFAGANLTALDSIDGGTGTDVITVPASATSSPDFDRISNLTSITGTNDAGDTTVAIAAIAETTAQVITITSIGDTATKGLVITNAADSATTTFSMVGATGDDFLIGSNGADTLSAAAGADTLQGGAGADSIVAGIGVDKVRVTTAVTADTITGFKANGADLLEHSVAALNAAGGAVAGAVTVMGDGLSAAQVGAGAAAFLALDVTAGGKTSLNNAELINVTNGGAGFADLGALETAMVGTNGLVTGGSAMVATDGMLFQYLNSTTSTFRTGVLRFDLGVGTTTNLAATDISLFETADVGAAALVTADTTYIA